MLTSVNRRGGERSAIQMFLKLSRFASPFALIGVVAILLVLGLNVSLNASQGPDEAAHFYASRFVAKHGRLPLNDEERLEAGYKADLPPLFYVITGMLGRGLDLESPPHLKITRDNPRLQLVTGVKHVKGWRVLPTEDPLRGEILLWYLGRWVALAFGVVGVALTYYLLRLAHPADPWLAVGGTALLAWLPAYHYVSGVASYESLTGALMVGYLIVLFLVIKYPARNRLYFGLGAALGLAGTARQTPWILLPFLPLFVLWLARYQRWPWSTTALRLGLVLAGILLTFGLWILYVSLYFNRVAQLGWFNGLLSPIVIGDGSDKTSLQIAGLVSYGKIGAVDLSRQGDSLWLWLWTLFTGVWGGGWLGWLLLAGWGVALAGVIRQWRNESTPVRMWTVVLALQVGLLMLFPLARFVFSGEAQTTMGQHTLFPAGAAMVVLLIYGLRGWLSPGRLAAGLLLLAGIYLWGAAGSARQHINPPYPLQTVPLSALEVGQTSFGELTLLDYALETDAQVVGITLRWRIETLPNEDYRFEFTLSDAAGQPQARWLGQPLNGRYPTRAWLPGDRVRTEFALPLTGLPPGQYQLRLQLWGEAGPVNTPAGESFSLGQLSLAPAVPAFDGFLTAADQEIGYTLWPPERSPASAPLYRPYEVVTVTTSEPLTAGLRLLLAGPAGVALEPTSKLGFIHTFEISPAAPGGEYRLRLAHDGGAGLTTLAESPVILQVETEPRLFEMPAVAYPVSANFAGYVGLLGYNLPQTRLEPGDALPVTLYWQALRTIGADLVLFNHLIGPDGRQWGGQDRRAQDVYSTMLWARGEIVPDTYSVSISPDAPPGSYYLLVGLYLPVGESAVSLPLVENGQMIEVTHVAVGPIEVVAGDTQP